LNIHRCWASCKETVANKIEIEKMVENNMTHDPSEYVRGLQQLLVSDKKKIAFLYGAGTSLSKKNKNSLNIPAIAKMTSDIEEELNKTKKYKKAIIEIRQEIEKKGNTYTVETLLSNLEQKREILGTETLNDLNQENISELIIDVKKEIQKIASIHKEILKSNNIKNLIHTDFAEWIGRADRKHAIEIFTTNYDYLFELGLESRNIPYYDGFTGSYQPFFNSDSIENLTFLPMQTKLWKIHGSLGWHLDEKSKNVWRKDSDNEDILIYPAVSKYNNSKKQPYIALMDRLANFLKQPDTVLITCGYSFGDEHINERILTALNSNPSTHIYALYYDIVWKEIEKEEKKKRIKNYNFTEDSELSKLAKSNRKISVYGHRNAVIGCQYGEWQLKREPDKDDTLNISSYFDEDAFDNENEIKKEKKGEEVWTGKGELTLPNFSKFVKFLKNMIYDDNETNKDNTND